MPFINFKCKKCKKVFDFDVGKIIFELVNDRPQFENQINCSHCGRLTLDEVELTEIGQTELTEIRSKFSLKSNKGDFRRQSPLTILNPSSWIGENILFSFPEEGP